MSRLHRLVLAVLLVLVVISSAGHLLVPNDGVHRAAAESTCTFHAGIVAPDILGAWAMEARDFSILSQDTLCALSVFAKIPHPPTI